MTMIKKYISKPFEEVKNNIDTKNPIQRRNKILRKEK